MTRTLWTNTQTLPLRFPEVFFGQIKTKRRLNLSVLSRSRNFGDISSYSVKRDVLGKISDFEI